MKKAAFFATIVLIMVVMGFLSPKQANAIIAVLDGYVGPFSLIPAVQAVRINLVNVGDPTALREGETCMVQVNFFSPDGMAITDGTRELCRRGTGLEGMEILTCNFDPEAAGFEDLTAFLAQVTIMGPRKEACVVLVTGEVYNMTSMATEVNINFTFPHL